MSRGARGYRGRYTSEHSEAGSEVEVLRAQGRTYQDDTQRARSGRAGQRDSAEARERLQ